MSCAPVHGRTAKCSPKLGWDSSAPELLVLDEATSSLDTEHELAIRKALAVLHGCITLLVIAHRLSTVRHADSIVVLDHGRVVETGTWEELAERDSGRLGRRIAIMRGG